jgi:hypothetical protein
VLAGAGLAFGVELVEVELEWDGVVASAEPVWDGAALLAEAEPAVDGLLLPGEVEPTGDGVPLPIGLEPAADDAAGLLEPMEGETLPLVALGPSEADALLPVAVEPA